MGRPPGGTGASSADGASIATIETDDPFALGDALWSPAPSAAIRRPAGFEPAGGPRDLLRLADFEEDGRRGVIYHSHTRSKPYPSQTDVNFAGNWPGVEWLIVGLAGDEPDVRNWRIADGQATEVEVRVDGA